MKRWTVMTVALALYGLSVIPAMAQSSAAATAATTASATMAVAATPGAAAIKAAKLAKAREEMAARLLDRQKEALTTMAGLAECVKKLPSGSDRRGAQKAITNLESAMAKAKSHASAGEFRRAFLALGRPQKAAVAAWKRCSGATP